MILDNLPAPFLVTKASGIQEPFNVEKFKHSLERAGATPAIIEEITQNILAQTDLHTTREIYSFAFNILRKKNVVVAARYTLKQALFQLGPDGYPFEQFVARIFQAQGYQASTGVVVPGICVQHEVDVVADKKGAHLMAECKFHLEPGIKSGVKIPLYVRARFDDIMALNAKKSSAKPFDPWLVTNTQFSSEAIAYGECAGLKLLGWGYPNNNGIERLIDKYHLHPITVLHAIKNPLKNMLLKDKIVLCSDLLEQRNSLGKYKIAPATLTKILRQAEEICEFDR